MDLRLEMTALHDQAVPARDLGICFALATGNKAFEEVDSYDEIYALLEELGYADE